MTIRIVVVLPAPLPPTNPVSEPAAHGEAHAVDRPHVAEVPSQVAHLEVAPVRSPTWPCRRRADVVDVVDVPVSTHDPNLGRRRRLRISLTVEAPASPGRMRPAS